MLDIFEEADKRVEEVGARNQRPSAGLLTNER